MLTLVHPPRGGNGGSPPSRRKGIPSASLSLTPDEARAVRVAARNIARQHFGTIAKLAAALGVDPGGLTKKRRPSAGLAVALARVSGMTVDAVLGWTRPAIVQTQLAPLPGKDGAS